MTTQRHPRPLFAAAAGLPLAAAVLCALLPEAWERAASQPALLAVVALAVTALPFGLFLLGFRDLGRTRRVPRTAGYALFMVLAAVLGGGSWFVVMESVGFVAATLSGLAAWTLFCAVSWPLYTWWLGEGRLGETLAAQACLAALCAAAASGANGAAAYGLHSYIKEVGERTAFCDVVAELEEDRLRRDSPRSLELDADVRTCAKPGYRFLLARRERAPRPWVVDDWGVSPALITERFGG